MSFRRTPSLLAFVLLSSVVLAGDPPRLWPANPFLPVTAERIVSLPLAAQPAWKAYWNESQARLKLLPAVDRTEHSPAAPVGGAPIGASYSMGLRLDASYTWYATEAARVIADRVLQWQSPAGGWSKDGNYLRDRTPDDRKPDLWSGGTYDNDSTISELRYLAKVISHDNAVPAARLQHWVEGFRRGLDYVLASQYPSGGFPQVYPLVGGYHDAITINDDAFVHILQFLQEIATADPEYAFVPAELVGRVKQAFDRGLACVLRLQLRGPDGGLTVWGQQYDAITQQPCYARNFEPAGECAQESAGVVKFLMGLPAPSPAVIASVDAAMRWFEARAIHDKYWDRNAPAGVGLADRPGAPDIWARLYEFNTGRPIFGDRDRRIYYDVSEISFERRKGYSWYTRHPAELGALYFYWQHKVAKTK